MDDYKKLVAEASDRKTSLNRVHEIRDEIKRLRKESRAVTEDADKSITKKQIKVEGEIINRYNDAYYSIRQD